MATPGSIKAGNAEVVALPVQDQHYTLRFVAPEHGQGPIIINIIDDRTGAVVRKIPWDSKNVTGSGSLLNYKI